MAARDRDETGRPRNDRPRDALGRPLPHGSPGVARIPEDLELAPHDSLTYAQRLLDQGFPFHAHDVLEAAWKTGPDSERHLWKALAQLAVGVTHIQRGNMTGAITLLRRAADGLAVGGAAPYGIDAAGLAAHAAALSEDLAAEVEKGTFRQDLYYRLNVLTLHLPPLRERGDDVIALAEHFVAHTAARYDRPVPTIDENARAAIRTYHWPGNVRELRHVVERAVLVHAEHVVEAAHLQLPAALSAPAQRESTDRATDNAANTTLADSERDLIERTLHQTQHNVSQAARQLGLSRGALRYRLEKYGLDGG